MIALSALLAVAALFMGGLWRWALALFVVGCRASTMSAAD
jgi:hypothetical protein